MGVDARSHATVGLAHSGRSVLFAPQLVRLAASVVVVLAAPVISRAQIRCGDTLRRTVAVGARTDSLTFDAQAGEVVSIAVAGVPDPVVPRTSPTWELHDPNDQFVRTSHLDKQCSGTCESLQLTRSGTYTIVLEVPNPGVSAITRSRWRHSQTANGVSTVRPHRRACAARPKAPTEPARSRRSWSSPARSEWGETDVHLRRHRGQGHHHRRHAAGGIARRRVLTALGAVRAGTTC